MLLHKQLFKFESKLLASSIRPISL